MDGEDLERRFHAHWLRCDLADRKRIAKLLGGVLAGRVTITLEEARQLSGSDVADLADALPGDALSDWIRVNGAN